jgi:hypothetical protein
MFWGPKLQGWRDGRYPGTILDQMLEVYNLTSYGRAKALSFLEAKYSDDIQALNTAWYLPLSLREVLFLILVVGRNDRNTTYGSFDGIRTRPSKDTQAHTNDSADFAYLAAVQFFNISRNCMLPLQCRHCRQPMK